MASPPITLEKELKKNPELKKSDLEILREWYKKQPHLPTLTDRELALFLHSNYYRLEPTKPTIDTYYTVRTHVPEFFADTDPIGAKNLRNAFNTVVYMPLAKPTMDGYKVIYGTLIDPDPSNYVYYDCIKYFNMVLDLLLHTEGSCKGHIILLDLKSIQFGHAGRLSPIGLKKFLYYLQEGLPVRLQGFHFMNSQPVMDIILSLMKPFMKKELMDIIHIHSSTESLTKFIPLDILPNENGGSAGPLIELHEANIKWLETNKEFFKNDEANMRVNEAARPGKSKNATNLFGVEGSFKKLEID